MRWRSIFFFWPALVLRLVVVLPLLCVAFMSTTQAEESASATSTMTAAAGQVADTDSNNQADQKADMPATPSGDYGWQSALPKLGPIVPTASTNGKKRKKEAAVVTADNADVSPSMFSSSLVAPLFAGKAAGTAQALRIVIGLTMLAILPSILVCLTSFLRIIIVLSMLRHAIGMQETPPNTVLIGLGLALTLFTMAPVLQQMNQQALQPFMSGQMSMQDAYDKGIDPLRDFMVRQTREQDLILLIELSKAKTPQSMADISNVQLIPAFMLSELRAAFQIGFVIFLPFLLIDLIVSSLLMALGMMMMPPTTISLPLKILMFILIDGWSLILKALVGSFH